MISFKKLIESDSMFGMLYAKDDFYSERKIISDMLSLLEEKKNSNLEELSEHNERLYKKMYYKLHEYRSLIDKFTQEMAAWRLSFDKFGLRALQFAEHLSIGGMPLVDTLEACGEALND